MSVKRDYPDHPFVGVSALIRHQDHIVLIERGKPPLQGAWSLPGGAVETGETLAEAIVREVHEETGIIFTPVGVGELVEVLRHDEAGQCVRHFVIAVFSGTLPDETRPPLTAGDDAQDAAWVPIDEITSYPLTEGTLEVIGRVLSGKILPHSLC